MHSKNYLITIIGPTAIGKTALSINLAQHFGCDIISVSYTHLTLPTILRV